MYTKSFSMRVLALASLVQFGLAHMHLEWPPTLKGANNPHTQGEPDPYLNYPYGCCGREVPGPCKGHLDLLNTDEGRPVATWSPGQKVNFTLSGSSTTDVKGGTHYGGSCQAGFSTDGGKTFKVAATWNGDCPHRDGSIDPSTQAFDFTVPADLPAGERTVFAWTWLNREKEFNMGCAVVSVSGTSDGSQDTGGSQPAPSSIAATPSSTSAAPYQPPSSPSALPAEPSSPPAELPTHSQPPASEPTGSAQYTLDGCTCACPYQTWSPACTCYSCKSPTISRRAVERKAFELHKRHVQNAAKLAIPVRRAETVAWTNRPDMLLSIDFEGAACHSQGNPFELAFPDPGPDVVEGDGEYKLAPPVCA